MGKVNGWLRRCISLALVMGLCWLVLPSTALRASVHEPPGGFGQSRDVTEKRDSPSGIGAANPARANGQTAGARPKSCARWVPGWMCSGYHVTKDVASAAGAVVKRAVTDAWETVKETWRESKVLRAIVFIVLIVAALVVAALVGAWLLIAVAIGALIGLLVNMTMYWLTAGSGGNWGDALLAGLAGAAVGAWIDVATLGLGKLFMGLKLGGFVARVAPRVATWWGSLSPTGKGVLVLLANMARDGVIGAAAYVCSGLGTGETFSWDGVLMSFGMGVAFGSVIRGRQVWRLVSQTQWGQRFSMRRAGFTAVSRHLAATGRAFGWLRGAMAVRANVLGRRVQTFLGRGTGLSNGPRFVGDPIPSIKGMRAYQTASDEEAVALVSHLVGEPTPGRHSYVSKTARELPNFEPGYVVHSGTLGEDLVLVQLHSGAPLGAGRSAKYWTSAQQANQFSKVDDYLEYLALIPDWGPRTEISVARIPAGTNVAYVAGAAAPQKSAIAGRTFMGQGLQFLFAEFDPSWIITTKPLR